MAILDGRGEDGKPTQPVRPEPGLRRLRAPNPSPLTADGTNTWLLGEGRVAVIDPGPAMPAHMEAILAALAPGERVSHILVTHAHLDHSALAPALAAETGAPVLAFGTAADGMRPAMASLAAALGPAGEGADTGFRPDRRLADGEKVEGIGWGLEAVHTPGHMSNHLCLAWGHRLFSGDHVMGWSTTVVIAPDGDMGAYMESLGRLATRPWLRMYPGHGDPVETPATRLSDLTAHRRARESQILTALRAGPATAAAIARAIYTDLAPALLPAAEQNVLAHLIDLSERSAVIPLGPLSRTARFALE